MEIIDDIVELDVKAVTFSGGGDPFCYPFLLDAVKKLSGSPVQFASLTNGSKLKGEIAETFSHFATWLRVSIDGWSDESYSRYRGVKQGEYTHVLSNMEQFNKLGGKCYLGISLIVDKDNVNHIYDSIKRFKNIGVDSVKVSPCVVSDVGSENNKYHKSIFSQVKDQVKRAVADFVDSHFEVYDAYHDLDEKFDKEHTWCPYIQILPIIGADLNIYACQDKAYNLKEGLIGSLANQRFKDFWFSDKNNFFKINPSLHCNHHCVANAKNKLILDYLNTDKEHLEFV